MYKKDVGLKCYDCGHEDEQDCSSEKSGKEVRCQMSSPEQKNYGDYCYVGHTGSKYFLAYIPYL